MMRELFLGTVIMKNITAYLFFDHFPVHFSDTGSNRREQEERIVIFWDNYNRKVEGKSNYVHTESAYNFLGAIYACSITFLLHNLHFLLYY